MLNTNSTSKTDSRYSYCPDLMPAPSTAPRNLKLKSCVWFAIVAIIGTVAMLASMDIAAIFAASVSGAKDGLDTVVDAVERR